MPKVAPTNMRANACLSTCTPRFLLLKDRGTAEGTTTPHHHVPGKSASEYLNKGVVLRSLPVSKNYWIA
jgi:hypothetical protein